MWVTYPGDKSYVNLFLNGAGPTLCPDGGTTEYAAWCSDVHDAIVPGTHYGCLLVNSFDPMLATILVTYVPGLNVGGTIMNELNYIMNRAAYYIYALGYSPGDVQTALWSLMFGSGTIDPSAPFDPVHVAFILADAAARGLRYKPYQVTDYFGIFCIPLGEWPVCGQTLAAQIMLIQVSVAHFPLPCIWEAAGGPCSFIQWQGLFTNTSVGTAPKAYLPSQVERKGATISFTEGEVKGSAAVYDQRIVARALDGQLIAGKLGLHCGAGVQLDLGHLLQAWDGHQPSLVLWGTEGQLYGSDKAGSRGIRLDISEVDDAVPIPSYGGSGAELLKYGSIPYRYITVVGAGLLALLL